MSRIGIMGGTFDPIHIGHLIAAESAREQCGLAEVWFIPSYQPPLKSNDPGVVSRIRYEMVCEAIKDNPSFRALDIELMRGGVSYSYDTVMVLKRLYPEYTFSYIIGSDRVNDLAKWYQIEKLANDILFIGLERPSDPINQDKIPPFLKDKLTIASMPSIGISSTAIRDRREAGRSIQYLVPDSVFELIRRYRLYES